MSTRLSCLGSYALKASAGAFLMAVSAFCQPAKSALEFESVDIQRSNPEDQVTTLGILPNGHV